MSGTITEILARLDNVELSSPLSEKEILDFEASHSIALPADYREFLLKVGGSGMGPPKFGLLRLGEVESKHVPDYLKGGYGDRLVREFPLTEGWMWEGEQGSPDFAGRLESVEQGCLALGNDGCGMFWLLVVSGACRGEVWQVCGEGITPCMPRLAFGEWYLKWLKGDTEWWSEA